MIDFDKSQGSWVHDKNTDEDYLDLFNQYSTNPLGYNHPIFDEEFDEIIQDISRNKICNCEILTEQGLSFKDEFESWAGQDYHNFYYSCTGGLAVESALKQSLDRKKGAIISFDGNFHGITGLGMFATSPFNPIDSHMVDFPHYINFKHLPFYDYISELDFINNNLVVSGVIVEPIQSTYGDRYFPISQLKELEKFCSLNNVLLIFDEVQTGFGSTGSLWYYEQANILPDITIFGKKTQVSGIMTNEPIDYDKQSVTWDGNLIDMVRCRYIMKAIKESNLIENIRGQGRYLEEIFDDFNFRGTGGFGCLEFSNRRKRNEFYDFLTQNNILCNKTRNKYIRFRLNLATERDDLKYLKEIADEF